MINNNKPKKIGAMTNSRMAWGFNASTRVVQNKKGKGSYKRNHFKDDHRKLV